MAAQTQRYVGWYIDNLKHVHFNPLFFQNW